MKDDRFIYSMDKIRIIDDLGKPVDNLDNHIKKLKTPTCTDVLSAGDIVSLKYEKCNIEIEEVNVIIGNEKYDYLGHVADISFYEPVYFNQYDIGTIIKKNDIQNKHADLKKFK